MNNLKILIKKLSNHARVALEKSANSCINQQNYEIEIEHFFLELLEQQETNDLHLLVEKYKISHDFLLLNGLKYIISTISPILVKLFSS